MFFAYLHVSVAIKYSATTLPSARKARSHLPFQGRYICTSQQILDTNHKKIYNKKLSVSQISVRNATCDIELASDSLTNKLDAVH